MHTQKTDVPSTSVEFDKLYHSPLHWFWTDIRIPKELKELAATAKPYNSLELGCGLGYFSTYMAKQGINATGVDFSRIAIERAIRRVAGNEHKPAFKIGDVTNLERIADPFDVSFDVGCFHCLHEESMHKYVSEIYRLLKPGATHLLWAFNHSPSDITLTSEYIRQLFGDNFHLVKSKFSRRRIIASYWYWLVRK